MKNDNLTEINPIALTVLCPEGLKKLTELLDWKLILENGYTFRGSNSASFRLYVKVQGAIFVTLTLASALALKFYDKIFLCVGHGPVKAAIQYMDRSCHFCLPSQFLMERICSFGSKFP